MGWKREGLLRNDLFSHGELKDRYIVSIIRRDWEELKNAECGEKPNQEIRTPIQDLGEFQGNHLYIKREDLIPYSFGGNKARKAILFFREIDEGNYDTVVTYGSSHSNHCRVVANMAAGRDMRCVIIGPDEVSDTTFNSQMMKLFGAEIITVPIDEVHDTIEAKLNELREAGKSVYFIPGGGHGNIGTEAYVQCYGEIIQQGSFDYIFFASGTGTTLEDDRLSLIAFEIIWVMM